MGKQTFTEEFKQETARLSFQTDKTLEAFAQDLGISRSSLSRWRKEYGRDGTPSVNSKATTLAADPAEIRRLQKALRIAEQERDILKKALAIFTQAPQ
jgi:transposase